jgi:DNA primase
MSARDADLEAAIRRAREADLFETANLLGAKLKKTPTEWVGPCPKGCAREDGFAVAPGKRAFFCRPSGTGGDVIALVEHVKDYSFTEAVEFLAGRSIAYASKSAPPAPAARDDRIAAKERKSNDWWRQPRHVP